MAILKAAESNFAVEQQKHGRIVFCCYRMHYSDGKTRLRREFITQVHSALVIFREAAISNLKHVHVLSDILRK